MKKETMKKETMKKETMKKETMKKEKLQIEWPTGPFTIDMLQQKYKTAVNITLRYRINVAKQSKLITEIGKTPKKMGRPTIVFGPGVITHDLLREAVASGVVLYDEFQSMLEPAARDIKVTTHSDVVVPVKNNSELTKKIVQVG